MAEAFQPFEAVGFLLSQVGYETADRFKQIIATLDLEPRQFAVLRIIGWSEGQPQQAVSDTLHIPASSMVALVDQLEGRGWVERRPDPADRRARTLHLTATGRRKLGRAMELAMGLESEITARLSDEERRELKRLLALVAGQLGLEPGVHPAGRSSVLRRSLGRQ